MEESGWHETADGNFVFEFVDVTPDDAAPEFFTWLEYLEDPEEWDS